MIKDPTRERVRAEETPFSAFQKAMGELEDGLCILGLSALVGLVALQIVGRFTPWSFPWTEELARYVFIWTVMVGMAAATREKEHVVLELGEGSLPRWAIRAIRVFAAIATLAFFVWLTVLGIQQTGIQMASSNLASSLPLPLWVVSASVPVAAGLAAAWTFRELLPLVARSKSLK
jgi:TRAP-type C4-dicarboxylate transport system permease small subunit